MGPVPANIPQDGFSGESQRLPLLSHGLAKREDSAQFLPNQDYMGRWKQSALRSAHRCDTVREAFAVNDCYWLPEIRFNE